MAQKQASSRPRVPRARLEDESTGEGFDRSDAETHGRLRALASAGDERKNHEGTPGTTGIVSASGGTSSQPDRRVTGPEQIRRGDTPETTRKEAPAHRLRVRAQFQRGRRRSGREPRSANRGSTPRGTLPLGVRCHATTPKARRGGLRFLTKAPRYHSDQNARHGHSQRVWTSSLRVASSPPHGSPGGRRVANRAPLGSDPYRGFGGAGAAEDPREVGRDFDKWRPARPVNANGQTWTSPVRWANGSRRSTTNRNVATREKRSEE